MSTPTKSNGNGHPHGGAHLRVTGMNATERAQAEAVAIVATALAAEGLADYGTPDANGIAYARMSHVLAGAKGVAHDAVALVRDAKERAIALRVDPATGLPVFVDNSISASKYARTGKQLDDNKKRRPAYERAIGAVRDGSIATVLVPHLDRLYRRPRELEDLCDLVEDANDKGRPVSIRTLYRSDYDLNEPNDVARARMETVMAAHQSDRTHQRILHDNNETRGKGWWIGSRAPMGYVRTFTAPFLELDPYLAPVIAKAVRDLIAGSTLSEIANEWQRNGVERPRNGNHPWDASQVRQRVSKHAIAGLLAHRPRPARDGTEKPLVITKGAWEPIVNQAEWEALTGVLARNASVYGRQKRRGPFTGAFVCGTCGGKLYRHPRNGTYAWACMKSKGGCGQNSVLGPQAEAWVQDHVLARLASNHVGENVEDDNGAVERAAGEVNRMDARLAELQSAYDAERLDLAEYLRMRDPLVARRTTAEADLLEAQRHALRLGARHFNASGTLAADWEEASADEKRRLIGYAYPYGIAVAPGYGRKNLDARFTPLDEPRED